MMSKKHYVAIAHEFHAQRNGAALESAAYQRGFSTAQYSIASALARVFANENPHFDRARFLEACGLSNPPKPVGKKDHIFSHNTDRCLYCDVYASEPDAVSPCEGRS